MVALAAAEYDLLAAGASLDVAGVSHAFDIDGAIFLFAPEAVIRDAFVGTEGVRRYLERFFVGYNTRSELLSIERV